MIEVRNILRGRGFALVLVVIVMTIVVTVGTILMSLSVQNSKINYDVIKYIDCYYIAYSQILHVIDIMRTSVELIYKNYSDPNSFFDACNSLILSDNIKPLEMKNSSYVNNIEVTMTRQSETKTEYKIEVTSTIDEVSRKFRAKIVIEWFNDLSLEEMFRVQEIEEI